MNPLPRYSLFAAMLATAGLPIYIHAPAFYAAERGVPLATIGAALLVQRLIDMGQDPLLGKLAAMAGRRTGISAALGLGVMILGMLALFLVPPFLPGIWWMSISLLLLFSGFSYLSILFYARGIAEAARIGAGGHIRLAAWRETGALVGISIAAVLPVALGQIAAAPYAAFALVFAALALLAGLAMAPVWKAVALPETGSFAALLGDRGIRRLLLIAVVNAAPVAVTATLFLFFVEYRLAMPGAAGPFLVLFFASAALAAPFWARLARARGTRRSLTAGMTLSVLAFVWAWGLGAGDGWQFAVISAASGAALGADMALLPALFAGRIAAIGGAGNLAFGLWNFAGKLALALAAAVALPALDAAGFAPGLAPAAQSEAALARLGLLYAGLPSALKILALVLLWTRPAEEMEMTR